MGLRMLRAPEEFCASVLADDGRVLKGRHRVAQDRQHRGRVGLVVPGVEGNDGMATGGVQGARYEVGLPAESRVDALVHEARVGLGEQIDLHGGVDREHGGVGGNARRIVHRLGPHHLELFVHVGPRVEIRRTDEEGSDHRRVGMERAGVVEVHDAVADHFRPYAQVPAGRHHPCRDGGDEPDAELQRRTVGRKGGDAFTDGSRGLLGPCRGGGYQRLVDLDHAIDRLHRDLTRAESVGHLGVHLRKHQPTTGTGLLHCGGEHVDLNPEGDLAVVGQ